MRGPKAKPAFTRQALLLRDDSSDGVRPGQKKSGLRASVAPKRVFFLFVVGALLELD